MCCDLIHLCRSDQSSRESASLALPFCRLSAAAAGQAGSTQRCPAADTRGCAGAVPVTRVTAVRPGYERTKIKIMNKLHIMLAAVLSLWYGVLGVQDAR